MNIVSNRIMSEFKKLFRRLLDEGKTLSFEQMLENVTAYLEVSCPDETLSQLKSWHDDIAHHHYLSKLVADGNFEELVFFGKSFVTKDGKAQSSIELDDDDFILAWTQLAFSHHIAWNHAHPFASFAVNISHTKTRVTLIHPSCSPDGEMRAFVRAHSGSRFKVSNFCHEEAQNILIEAIAHKKNIIMVGATQSGKTTLMRACLDLVDENEHVVILEDTHEIKRSAVRTTSLLADAVDPKRSLSEYCAMALRMSPDRIVLGEIRSKEVVPLMLAFNSGHRGGLTSLHAESVTDALERLSLLFHLYSGSQGLPHEKVMELVCRNIDLVVVVKDKQVTEISKIIGSERGLCLYETLWPQQGLQKPCLESDQWWKKASGH